MFRMNTASLRATLEQLQQASHDHHEWREHLSRAIVCRLTVDPIELAADAHRHCRFGQWYYAEASADMRRQPLIGAMAAEHERVHVLAARLLPDLREWRELANRDIQSCCIAFMDVDHLKTLNDVHGHTVGDQVLARMIEHLAGHLRPYDKVYRYGGDEFVVSLPATDLAHAERLIERIRASLAQVPLVVAADGSPIHATASFGIALLAPDISVEESIDRADRALLLAKTLGRNRAISWDPAIVTGRALSSTPEGEVAT
jgi:diguanylate cyclase